MTITSLCIHNSIAARVFTHLTWDTNMAAVSLFWDTNMAAVTLCENTLFDKSKPKHIRSSIVGTELSCFLIELTFVECINVICRQPIDLVESEGRGWLF